MESSSDEQLLVDNRILDKTENGLSTLYWALEEGVTTGMHVGAICRSASPLGTHLIYSSKGNTTKWEGSQFIYQEAVPNTWFSCRYALAFLLFMGTLSVQAMRTAFNIALVAMVNFTGQGLMNNTNDECPVHQNGNHSSLQDGGEFRWDSTTQDTLLSAFFYGYITTQLVGGILADKVGAKLTIGIPVLSLSVLTLLIPIVARTDVRILIALRVLQGVLSGPLYPAIGAIWGRWAPPQEKTKLLTWSSFGGNLGTMIGEVSAGALCQSDFLGGWPSALYVIGSVGLLWCILWFALGHDLPRKHPRISRAELQYIEESNGGVDTISFRIPPVRKLLASSPVWAATIVSLTSGFSFYMIVNCGPLYMRRILNFDIAQNGILSPLPFLMMWITSSIAGPLADQLRRRISTTATRNIFTCIGEMGCAACLAGVALVGCDHVLAVLFLALAGTCGGFGSAGSTLAAIDNAPMYAGTLTGIYNGANQIGGILAPQIQGLITHGEPSRSKWKKVFFVTAGNGFLGALVFIILFSGKELEWAKETRIRWEQDQDKLHENQSGRISVNT